MKTEIHWISSGTCHCYLIKEEGLILVDAGFPGRGKKFLVELKNLSIEPKDISLILLTHGHWDHIGSANELKELTGAKIGINQREKDWVERNFKPTPPGTNLWGKILRATEKMYISRMNLTGTSVDLVLEDKDYSLESYGIHGKVIYTPGHSSGSMSLLLDTGDAFVGDMAMNGFPMRIGPGMPVFAEDIPVLKESWRLLMSRGVNWIYPAHGKPFKAAELEKLL